MVQQCFIRLCNQTGNFSWICSSESVSYNLFVVKWSGVDLAEMLIIESTAVCSTQTEWDSLQLSLSVYILPQWRCPSPQVTTAHLSKQPPISTSLTEGQLYRLPPGYVTVAGPGLGVSQEPRPPWTTVHQTRHSLCGNLMRKHGASFHYMGFCRVCLFVFISFHQLSVSLMWRLLTDISYFCEDWHLNSFKAIELKLLWDTFIHMENQTK